MAKLLYACQLSARQAAGPNFTVGVIIWQFVIYEHSLLTFGTYINSFFVFCPYSHPSGMTALLRDDDR